MAHSVSTAKPCKLVLLIHSLGPGGAERVLTTLANHWAERGWSVSLVTLASRDQDRYQVHPAVHRIALNQAGESRGLFSALFQNIGRIRAVRRVLLSERPVVTVAMMSTCNVLLALASVGLKGTRIGSERIHPPQVRMKRFWERLRVRTYALLDAVVVVAGESREWMLAHTAARNVVVIPNPVVLPLLVQAPVRAPQSVGSPHRRRLLTVGRLEHQKGFDLLINAFAELAPRFPDWELVILGEGSERPRLQRQIDELALSDVVLLPGHAGNVGAWYEHADLFALASRFEGFPNALVEALAHGLPAVSVDCDTGPRDIIRHEVDGLLVPAGDQAALARALCQLMGNPGQRAQFRRSAVEVRTRFSIERVGALWEQLFHESTS